MKAVIAWRGSISWKKNWTWTEFKTRKNFAEKDPVRLLNRKSMKSNQKYLRTYFDKNVMNFGAISVPRRIMAFCALPLFISHSHLLPLPLPFFFSFSLESISYFSPEIMVHCVDIRIGSIVCVCFTHSRLSPIYSAALSSDKATQVSETRGSKPISV